MKLLKQITLILIIFLKTGNLLSSSELFNVNNILLEKKENVSNKQLTNKAIKQGFDQLILRVLLEEDISKVRNLKFSEIKELVAYYNISKKEDKIMNKVNFSVNFDKDKIHDLFYKKGISYSDITDKEFYILPILIKKNQIYVFSNNYFYKNWNEINQDELIEFILPLENIEIIQSINKSRDNLFDLQLTSVFKEYLNKNSAIILIDINNSNEKKIYIKAKIQEKNISKNMSFMIDSLSQTKLEEKIISDVKDEITNLVKSQNLIDIRTPSFLNVKLNLKEKNNLVLFNKKIRKIDLIENTFVQEFNKDHVDLKIKYLGKLDRLTHQLKTNNINLKMKDNEWYIEIM